MMQLETFRWLAGLIAAHPDRRVIGRTRLQKEVRLLQRKGFPTEFNYRLHFYGPYSEGLNSVIKQLEQFGLLKEELKHGGGDKPYYIITASDDAVLPEIAPYQSTIDVLQQSEDIPLELAATYDSYRESGEKHAEAMKLLRQKKGSKCDGDNVKKALKLLQKLDLPHS